MYYKDEDEPLSYTHRRCEMNMIDLKILDIGDPTPFPELADKKITEVEISKAVIIQSGTSGGLPSVCFLIDLPDGGVILLQTTGRLFNMLNGALIGACQRWGVEL